MKTGKYTLVYSDKMAEREQQYGQIGKTVLPSYAVTNDGIKVQFTLCMDENKSGRWTDFYKWPDAVVVGYIDNEKQIIERRPIQVRNVVNPVTS